MIGRSTCCLSAARFEAGKITTRTDVQKRAARHPGHISRRKTQSRPGQFFVAAGAPEKAPVPAGARKVRQCFKLL